MSRIAIAGDDAALRENLEAALLACGHSVVASVGGGEAAARTISDAKPDVVILDLGAVGALAGWDSGDRCPIIVLADDAPGHALLGAIGAGAVAILRRDGAELHLAAALDAMRRGARYIDGELMDRAFALAAKTTDTMSGVLDRLSPRERLVAREVAKGLTNREIAEALNTTVGTVKVCVHNIFSKVKVKNRTELALLLGVRPESQSLSHG